MSKHIDIVFDAPPGHEAPRFIEVEDDTGAGMKFGEWVERDDGSWALRFTKKSLLSMLNEVSKINGHSQHAPGLWQCPSDLCPICMHDSVRELCGPET